MHLNLDPMLLAETAVAGAALIYLSSRFASRDGKILLKGGEYAPLPAMKIPWSDWTNNVNNSYWKFTKEIPNWVNTWSYDVRKQEGVPTQNFEYEPSLERPYSGKGENTLALMQSKQKGFPEARTIRPLFIAQYYDWVNSKAGVGDQSVRNFWHQVADRVGVPSTQ